jgi:hypothetical protein
VISGIVGLWAALDAFYERAGLTNTNKCAICDSRYCIPARFANYCEGDESKVLAFEDLRHLYAHNYVGEADDKYFERKRHVLTPDGVKLTCCVQFDGHRANLVSPIFGTNRAPCNRRREGCRVTKQKHPAGPRR